MRLRVKATTQKKASLVDFLTEAKEMIKMGEDYEYTFQLIIDKLKNSKLDKHPMLMEFKRALKDLNESGEINFQFNDIQAIEALIKAAAEE